MMMNDDRWWWWLSFLDWVEMCIMIVFIVVPEVANYPSNGWPWNPWLIRFTQLQVMCEWQTTILSRVANLNDLEWVDLCLVSFSLSSSLSLQLQLVLWHPVVWDCDLWLHSVSFDSHRLSGQLSTDGLSHGQTWPLSSGFVLEFSYFH